MDSLLPVQSSHHALPYKTSLLPPSNIPLTISFTLDTLKPVPEADCVTRCDTCKCYLNPYVEIIQPGYEFRCNLCYNLNKVPNIFNRTSDNFQNTNKFEPSVNIINNRVYESVELNSEVYEVLAAPSYVLKAPGQPVLVFVVEFTEVSMRNFSVSTIINEIRENFKIINKDDENKDIYKDENNKVVNKDENKENSNQSNHSNQSNQSNNTEKMKYCVIFMNEFCYMLNKNGTLIVIPDTNTIPALITDEFLFRTDQSFDMSVIDQVKPGQMVDMYGAMSLASAILKPTGGTIFTFISSVPYISIDNSYSTMSTRMSHYAICVNLFLFPTINVNLKDFDILSKSTGGAIYYYPNYNGSDIYFVNRFVKDFHGLLSRGFYNDAICKIRGSEGVKIIEYSGNFTMRSNDILAFSNFNPKHIITIKYTLAPALKSEVCFQAAILRTVKNRRMIRVTNYMIPFDMNNDVYSHIQPHAVINHYSAFVMKDLEKARENINNFMLKVYKSNPLSALPQNLEVLPLLCLALSKTLPLRPSAQTPTDYRRYYTYLFTNHNSSFVDFLVHPVLLPLHTILCEENFDMSNVYNQALILTVESLLTGGLYLLDTGVNTFIYDMDSDLTEHIIKNLETGRVVLEKYENMWSVGLHRILAYFESMKPVSMNVFYVKGGSKTVFRDIFMSYLVCDENNGMVGYNEYVKQFSKVV